MRRTGVRSSGANVLGTPIWLFTRVRWQVSAPRTRSVEVMARGRRDRSIVPRQVFEQLTTTRRSARAIADDVAGLVDAGELDHFVGGDRRA